MFKKIILILFALVAAILLYFHFYKNNASTYSKVVGVLKGCLGASSSNYYSCFRKRISPLVVEFGVNNVINSMNFAFNNKEFVSNNFSCHDLSHIVGEIASYKDKSIGETLIGCTKSCEYGCAHGALIAGISKNPYLLNNLSDVCLPFNSAPYNPQDYSSCEHGLGHAVSEFVDLDLNKSLQLCDRIKSEFGRNKCAEGVFMQTIDYPDVPTYKINGTIVNFCKSLPTNFLGVCFETASLHEHGRSKDDILSIKTCDLVPNKYYGSCVINLMNLLYSNYNASPTKLMDFCDRYSTRDYNSCLMGIIQSDVVSDSSAKVSKQICSQVEAKYKSSSCYKMLGERYVYVYGQKLEIE